MTEKAQGNLSPHRIAPRQARGGLRLKLLGSD